jgi:hypothetical protein
VIVVGVSDGPESIKPIEHDAKTSRWRMHVIAGGYQCIVWMPDERIPDETHARYEAEVAAKQL